MSKLEKVRADMGKRIVNLVTKDHMTVRVTIEDQVDG